MSAPIGRGVNVTKHILPRSPDLEGSVVRAALEEQHSPRCDVRYRN